MANCRDQDCQTPDVDGRYRRILWVALGTNIAMFFVEIFASFVAGPVSLRADARFPRRCGQLHRRALGDRLTGALDEELRFRGTKVRREWGANWPTDGTTHDLTMRVKPLVPADLPNRQRDTRTGLA